MNNSLAKRRNLLRMSSQAKAAFFFMLPSLFILGAFVVLPIMQTGWLSLQNWRLEVSQVSFAGLQNYQRLFADDRFWNALRNTAIYTLFAVPFQIGLGLLFALILNDKIGGKAFFRAVFFLPVIVSFAVEAIVWRFLLDPDIGMISYFITSLHMPMIGLLRSTTWALPTIVLVSVWRSFGYNLVILLAGLQSIPEQYYEAAKVDGADKFQRFFNVTFPLMRPALIFALVNSVIASLQVFDQIYVMTRGGPLFSTETIVSYLYHQGFEIFNFGYASAAACVLFVIIFVITLFQLKILRYQEAY